MRGRIKRRRRRRRKMMSNKLGRKGEELEEEEGKE